MKLKNFKKENWFKLVTIFCVLGVVIIFPSLTHAFVEEWNISAYNSPGFFSGIWHGLLAPYSLIVRWFMDIQMYATSNTGWFYDLGFLLGVGASLPIGWIAATFSLFWTFL